MEENEPHSYGLHRLKARSALSLRVRQETQYLFVVICMKERKLKEERKHNLLYFLRKKQNKKGQRHKLEIL
jgi:hypothetical protein